MVVGPRYTFQQTPVRSSGETECQELEIDKLSKSFPSKTSESPSKSPSPRDGTEGPWNPLQHNTPRFTPSFTAFAPDSPSESVLTGSLRASQSPCGSLLELPSKDVKPHKSKCRSKKEPIQLGWEHMVIEKGGLRFVAEEVQKVAISRKKFGCRKGKLDPQNAEKIREVRKIKACWTCWNLKTPVSFRFQQPHTDRLPQGCTQYTQVTSHIHISGLQSCTQPPSINIQLLPFLIVRRLCPLSSYPGSSNKHAGACYLLFSTMFNRVTRTPGENKPTDEFYSVRRVLFAMHA
jgi:hypothetical protein